MVRTHMIFSPTNREMTDANQPNACNMCHVRETLAWTLDKLARWYGAEHAEPNEPSAMPATLEWLQSWHPTTQMVAADVLTKANAHWALPQIVSSLDSRYMLVRQFAQIGLDRMLDTRLDEFGYRFYMFDEERRPSIEAILDHYLPDRSTDFLTTTMKSGTEEEDLEHYRELIQFKPDSPTAHYYLANALLLGGQLDEAVLHYEKATEIDRGFARAHNNLGVALKEQGKLDEAAKQHRRALSLEPRLADAHVALGNVLLMQGQSGEAAKQFVEAIAIDPQLAQAHYNLGLWHHSAGSARDAIASFRRAVAIEPAYSEAHNNLGIALASIGKHDEAIEAFERALEADDDVAASAHNNLGWAFKLMGRLDAALEHFEQAFASHPDSISTQVGLASVLTSHEDVGVRDPARAVELAQAAALATGEQSAEVLDILAISHAASGDYKNAVAAAEKALRVAPPDDELARQIQRRLQLYRRELER